MADILFIQDLLVRTIIGVSEDERRDRQDVLVSVQLETDTSAPGRSDEMRDAVNYRTISKNIIALAEGTNYVLVERFAEEIALLCLQDQRIRNVTVTVEKPGALRFARTVGVTIQRGRENA
jgi:D-erythro-7,8-dihydroneopterin triphosphate epimerase